MNDRMTFIVGIVLVLVTGIICGTYYNHHKTEAMKSNIDSAIVKGIAQFGPPPSPAGIAAIASAALIGATQIAAIASTKYQSGTAPTFDTGGGVSAGAGSAALGGQNANTNTQQTDLTALAAEQSAGVNQVYVLESDITSTQNNVAIQNKLSVW